MIQLEQRQVVQMDTATKAGAAVNRGISIWPWSFEPMENDLWQCHWKIWNAEFLDIIENVQKQFWMLKTVNNCKLLKVIGYFSQDILFLEESVFAPI